MTEKLSTEGLKSVAEIAKQIITLSTGVIALTVTFLEKILQPGTPAAARQVPWAMFAAWISFGLAIIAAVAVLMAISGTLEAIDRKINGQELKHYQTKAIASLSNGSNIRIPGLIMMGCFLLAMMLTVWTGIVLTK